MVQRQTSVDASQSLKDTGFFFCLFSFLFFLTTYIIDIKPEFVVVLT